MIGSAYKHITFVDMHNTDFVTEKYQCLIDHCKNLCLCESVCSAAPLVKRLFLPLSQGEVEILWEVYDLDASSRIDAASDLAARLLIPVPPLHPGNLTDVLEFIATNCSGCTLQLRFRFSSVPPSTGPNCSCVPANDTSGHFMCDPDTGERLCLDGYRNPESRCTECIPAINRSTQTVYRSGEFLLVYCMQPHTHTSQLMCRRTFW